MAKRAKAQDDLYQILTFDQADNHVRSIGELQREIDKLEADTDEAIEVIKANAKKDVGDRTAKIKKHLLSLETFCVANREDFGDKQSRKLLFGILGWRKSTKIILSKKTTLQKIKEVFGAAASQYLHIKEKPDKDAIRKLTDEQLKQIDVKRGRGEEFYVEPDQVQIEKSLTQ
ncbi:MAG: host-nuclease inhibitor Gam family protein [Planctomycetaceae bacterium]|nr:host-nuclease inhibitor Gam family protein [Planctomycetaceae bacterium]